MRVYPAPGLRVRNPATRQFIPDTGLEVSDTDLTFARLLRDKDVVTTPPTPESASSTSDPVAAAPTETQPALTETAVAIDQLAAPAAPQPAILKAASVTEPKTPPAMPQPGAQN